MWQRVMLVGLLVATPLVGMAVGLTIAELLQKPAEHVTPQETVPFLGRGTVQTAASAALRAPPARSAEQSPPKMEKPLPPPVATPPKRAGVLDLQPFHTNQSATGRDGVSYRLVQPNPYANSWLLLQRSGEEPVSLHLENPFPAEQRIELSAEGLTIRQGSRETMCRWADGGVFEPARAALTPVCHGRLWLRTARRGFRTRQDAVVEALRGLGDFGEGIVNLYKTEIQKDALAEAASWQVTARAATAQAGESLPLPALMQPNTESVPVQRDRLGIDLAAVEDRAPLALGRWYLAANHPGVAVSMAIPGRIAADILASHQERVAPLEMPEATALAYMLAFDLDRHELKYRLGADHPAVGWSRRAQSAQDEPGPDGFATISPFVRVAMVNPYDLPRLAATLPGGFKREHGAFKYGALARSNQGNHYGFMEEGVVLSRLQPGLASVIGRLDGGIELKSWDGFDEQRLGNLRFVRQNGVPLIEATENGRPGIPGRLVNHWGDGNWSGGLTVAAGDDGNPRRGGALRSLRSGICVQTAAKGKRWLIYGWFTAATPSAMARMFQAYRCDYALHLDMNSADLTYAALYRKEGGRLWPEYLNQTMADAEAGQGQLRYVTTNDSRDFFIVLQKKP